MKLLAELQIGLNKLRNEAEVLNKKEGVTIEEIQNISNEIKLAKAKVDSQLQIEADEEAEIEATVKAPIAGTVLEGKEVQDHYVEVFYNALRGKSLNAEDMALLQINNALSSTSDADGGYLIPVDQQTAINELKREFLPLDVLVNIEPVSTLTGNRNIEVDAQYTPFVTFTEGDDVPDSDTPTFRNIVYAILDRGGILPMPNNLLNDNTANLQAYLNRWLAKKSVATRNSLIVTLLKTLLKTQIADIDDVKKILNITLDPAISAMAIVVMNQDAFNVFDTMKDGDGKPVLQPNPLNATQKMIAGKVIHVYSNKTLPTVATKAPVLIGSLKEAVTLFDRQQISLLSTTVGGTAFAKNRTDIRAITREDVRMVDTDALVFAELTIV
jgi:HK97 family phage major capsid protein